MNLRPYRRAAPDINLTPLLDVVFLLLIFFMVSTTFKDEARLRVQLPQAQGEDIPTPEPAHIRLAIDRAGDYYVDDRAVADRGARTLVRALNGALGERKDLPVLIQADAQTPHQAVMTALDAAAELGLNRIAFAATRPGGEPSGERPGGQGDDRGGDRGPIPVLPAGADAAGAAAPVTRARGDRDPLAIPIPIRPLPPGTSQVPEGLPGADPRR